MNETVYSIIKINRALNYKKGIDGTQTKREIKKKLVQMVPEGPLDTKSCKNLGSNV